MIGTEPTQSPQAPPRRRNRPRVVIAGGGVGALEALLAIRELMGDTASVELVCPHDRFLYRPTTVTEPFEMGEAESFDLASVARELNAELRVDALKEVEPRRRVSRLFSGVELSYDALIVATGARRRIWLDGAVTFRGRVDVEALRALLRDLDAGEVGRVAFAGVPGESWLLPLYELALLTAAHVADQRLGDVRLMLITPEPSPLGLFGPRASESVRQLLADRGIELHTTAYPARLEGSTLSLVPDGTLFVDRVVTLARIDGSYIAGLPHSERGFIPTDEHGRVEGLDDVYAAGDGTTFPIKQGGIAAQQADAAAETIAASFGVPIEPQPFKPVLRGMLLTGLGATYLRRDISGRSGDTSDADSDPLWWPPVKVAGRRLGPYLAQRVALLRDERLRGRAAPVVADPAGKVAHRAARDLALALADANGGWGDYEEALQAIDAAVAIDGTLPREYIEARQQWRAAREGSSP